MFNLKQRIHTVRLDHPIRQHRMERFWKKYSEHELKAIRTQVRVWLDGFVTTAQQHALEKTPFTTVFNEEAHGWLLLRQVPFDMSFYLYSSGKLVEVDSDGRIRGSEYSLEYFIASIDRIVEDRDWSTALHTVEEQALALNPVSVGFDDDEKELKAWGF